MKKRFSKRWKFLVVVIFLIAKYSVSNLIAEINPATEKKTTMLSAGLMLSVMEKGIENSQGEINAAIVEYKKILNENPQFWSVYCNLAEAYEYKREYKKAIEMLNRVITSDSSLDMKRKAYMKTVMLYAGRAIDYYEKDNIKQMFQEYEKAIQMCDESYKFFEREAKIKSHNNVDTIGKAMVAFREKKTELHKEVEEQRGYLRNMNNENLQLQILDYCADARKYKEAGDYKKTLKILEQILTIDSSFSAHYPVYYEMGICYKKLKKFQQAEKMFKKELSAKPDSIQAYSELLELLYKQGRYEEARNYAKVLLGHEPLDKIEERIYYRKVRHILDTINKAESERKSD
ncbi:MAG: tetratricopeptide repeat protein [Thermotogota bacterium]|nr:tetratricopeptide repeat protein [Thermotogota bacterium]